MTQGSIFKLPNERDAQVRIGVVIPAVVDIEPIGIEIADTDSVAIGVQRNAPVPPVFGDPLSIIDHVNGQNGFAKDSLMATFVLFAKFVNLSFLLLPVQVSELAAKIDEIIAGLGFMGRPFVFRTFQPPGVIFVKTGLAVLAGSALVVLFSQAQAKAVDYSPVLAAFVLLCAGAQSRLTVADGHILWIFLYPGFGRLVRGDDFVLAEDVYGLFQGQRNVRGFSLRLLLQKILQNRHKLFRIMRPIQNALSDLCFQTPNPAPYFFTYFRHCSCPPFVLAHYSWG